MLAAATNLATISGTLFDDANSNGQVDAGETRHQAAQVQLVDLTGSAATIDATTNNDGFYIFRDITAGSYAVRQTAQIVGGRQLLEKTSPTIVVTSDDVTGTISTPIDSFTSNSETVSDSLNDTFPAVVQMNAPEAIGLQRDLVVNDTSASDDAGIRFSVASDIGVISFDSFTGGDGERRVIWDGIDNDPVNVDDTGLGNVDLTSAGVATGFNLVGNSDSDDAVAILCVYSDDGIAGTASRFSFARVDIPFTTDFDIRETEFVPFTALQDVGGGADLTAVTAIELEIEAGRRINGSAELIGAFKPTPFTANFDSFDEAELELTKSVNNQSPNVGENGHVHDRSAQQWPRRCHRCPSDRSASRRCTVPLLIGWNELRRFNRDLERWIPAGRTKQLCRHDALGSRRINRI